MKNMLPYNPCVRVQPFGGEKLLGNLKGVFPIWGHC